MKFTLKKSLYLSIAALMLGSVAAPAVSADANVGQKTNVNRSVKPSVPHNSIKQYRSTPLPRVKRYQHQLNVHKRDLRRLQHRIRVHRFNARLVKRLNRNKAKLINIINSNQRGLLRLAKRVVAEKHEVNLIRHGRSFPTLHKHPGVVDFNQTPARQVASADHDPQNRAPVQNHQTASQSYGESTRAYYTNDNGHTNSGVNHINFNGNHVREYGENNGKYYSYPNASDQLTGEERDQVARQLAGFNHAQLTFNRIDSVIDGDVNRLNYDFQQSMNYINDMFND